MAVVVVESPAKAKKINGYLGNDYTVLASFGHVRDLPPKDGSVAPDDDFAMRWEVDSKSKKRVDEIAKACRGASNLYLATDPDREGEAISWHLTEERLREFVSQTSTNTVATLDSSNLISSLSEQYEKTFGKKTDSEVVHILANYFMGNSDLSILTESVSALTHYSIPTNSSMEDHKSQLDFIYKAPNHILAMTSPFSLLYKETKIGLQIKNSVSSVYEKNSSEAAVNDLFVKDLNQSLDSLLDVIPLLRGAEK